jgi:cytolysin (calcineurin-like family phosphatase)
MGGFAVAHVTEEYLDVILAEVASPAGELSFTHAFSKSISFEPLR